MAVSTAGVNHDGGKHDTFLYLTSWIAQRAAGSGMNDAPCPTATPSVQEANNATPASLTTNPIGVDVEDEP